jgi:hypothetical protein
MSVFPVRFVNGSLRLYGRRSYANDWNRSATLDPLTSRWFPEHRKGSDARADTREYESRCARPSSKDRQQPVRQADQCEYVVCEVRGKGTVDAIESQVARLEPLQDDVLRRDVVRRYYYHVADGYRPLIRRDERARRP